MRARTSEIAVYVKRQLKCRRVVLQDRASRFLPSTRTLLLDNGQTRGVGSFVVEVTFELGYSEDGFSFRVDEPVRTRKGSVSS